MKEKEVEYAVLTDEERKYIDNEIKLIINEDKKSDVKFYRRIKGKSVEFSPREKWYLDEYNEKNKQ